MKFQCLIPGFMGLLVLTSCSSVRKLAAKDSPVTTTMAKKPRNTGKRDFLDQEVTPGGMVTSTHQKKITQPIPPVRDNTVSIPNTKPPETTQGSVEIQNATMLQLKYAVAMDATVEMLTNIPLLEVIDKWWGTKYCMGGSTDNCIDCSAFTQVLMRDVYQQNLPRTAEEQFNSSEHVELEDLKEGDLVFFNTGGKDISHVGVYLLNNKFVHASTSGGVMISDLNDTYWQPKYRGAGRMVASSKLTSIK